MQMEAEQLLEQARAVLRSRIDVPLKDAISAFRRALVAGSAVAAAELALLFLARPRASTLFGLTAHEAFAAATASHNRGCSSGTAALSWFHRCADFSDIDQNAELAVSLATQAATGNDAWGLYALGVCLLANASARLHRSIDSDVADAEVDEQAGLELLERAADDGLPIAVHTLALVYEARDENEVADALFRRAIELHHPAAAAHLGSRLLSCATDAGTRGDALKLLEPAARADEVEALLALSRFYADDAPLKAIELCQRAVLLDPTEATALLTDLQSRVTPSADTSVIASASSPVSAASPPSSSVASSPTIINQTTPISLASLAASPSSPEQPPSLASIASASSPVNSRLVRSNSDLESPPIKSPLLSSFHLDSPTMAPLSMAVSKASSPTLTATKTSTPKIELSAKIAPAAMTITVSDPETRMNWGTKHLTYLVTSAHAAVRRRFSDFVWLRDILCNQYPGYGLHPSLYLFAVCLLNH
jgi:TPR repeat protein